ncbi:MAG: M48 family metalloprotease [Candidatus Acidiferrales bacterium]
MQVHPRIALTALLALLAVASAPAGGEAAGRRVRGAVLEVFDDGSFQLEDGLVVRVTNRTSVSRPLLVGQRVEASGEMGTENELIARRVEARAVPGGEVRGQAVLEDAREHPRGTLLLADGRRLLVTKRTRTATEDFAPGTNLTYRGRWAEGGVVELTEVSAAANRLEEKEKAIYDAYRPEIQFVAGSPDQPAALRVGENRYAVVNDRRVQLYFDQLGSRLAPALWRDPQDAERFGFSLWFVLATHERPQASAFPSGVIVVHTGLLELAENEAQLAFVVAHELAHVLEEHAWRESGYHRKKLQALRWSTAGIAYVVESAIRSGYQRELEAQADRLALWYLAQAGFDPREGVRMLQRMEARQEGLSALLWEKHRTFPQRRRAVIEELFRYSEQGLAYSSLTRNSAEFMTMRALVPTAGVTEARDPARPRR